MKKTIVTSARPPTIAECDRVLNAREVGRRLDPNWQFNPRHIGNGQWAVRTVSYMASVVAFLKNGKIEIGVDSVLEHSDGAWRYVKKAEAPRENADPLMN